MSRTASVEYTLEAQVDILRLSTFLLDKDALAAYDVFQLIKSGIAILEQHPLAGRPVGSGLRELVISFGKTGYLANYEFNFAENKVLILAIKHQRESGYH